MLSDGRTIWDFNVYGSIKSVVRGISWLLSGLFLSLLLGAAWLYLDRTGFFTDYADGFSERRFASIRIGDEVETVLDKLGPPLRKSKATEPKRYTWIPERIVVMRGEIGEFYEISDPLGLIAQTGLRDPSIYDLRKRFGLPDEVVPAFDWDEWHYTKYEFGRNHQTRIVVIDAETKNL